VGVNMDKYYQVFVSSTFADLIEERRYVMQALMEMNTVMTRLIAIKRNKV
jgi:hypothetical protein